MQKSDKSRLIGHVVGTEKQPNTAFEFYFWASPKEPLGIGSLVVASNADETSATVWGVVTEALGYNDLQTALVDFVGSNASPDRIAPTLRPEIRVYKAAVLRRFPEEPVQPAAISCVYLADETDVLTALKMDKIPAARRLAAGLYQNGEVKAPVYLDWDFLLGPEAGHVNVTGTSGLAAKTSLMEFLLTSIFSQEDKRVAALCFNVKGPDLLFLDHQPHNWSETEPSEEQESDCEMYDLLGIKPQPFQNVEYYVPICDDGFNEATIRTNEDLKANVHHLQWGLKEVFQYKEVMLNKDDIDAKADAFLSFIWQKAVKNEKFEFTPEEQSKFKLKNNKSQIELPQSMDVKNFSDLNKWLEQIKDYLECINEDRFRSHAAPTIYKIQNRLANLTSRYAGLLTETNHVSDLKYGEFKDKTVYVVDVANLRMEAQDLVFTRIISQLREKMETRSLGVDTLIVMVDELNQYAPGGGKETYVSRTIRDIASRGRYLGLILFGAQQFRSQVDRQVVGNCSTSFFGQVEMEELAQPSYSVFDKSVKEKLGSLPPGEMLIRHPHFQQPIFLKFPRPCVMRGRDGVDKFPPKKKEDLVYCIFRDLNKMNDAICVHHVQDALSVCGNIEEESSKTHIINAINETKLSNTSDPLFYFKTRLPNIKTFSTPPSKIEPIIDTSFPPDELCDDPF